MSAYPAVSRMLSPALGRKDARQAGGRSACRRHLMGSGSSRLGATQWNPPAVLGLFGFW